MSATYVCDRPMTGILVEATGEIQLRAGTEIKGTATPGIYRVAKSKAIRLLPPTVSIRILTFTLRDYDERFISEVKS